MKPWTETIRFHTLFIHFQPYVLLLQVWKRLQGEIKQYFLILSPRGVQYPGYNITLLSSSVHLGLFWMSIWGLFSLWPPCLSPCFPMLTPKFFLTQGAWCCPGWPGKGKAPGWCSWLHPSGYDSLESTRLKGRNQWKGQESPPSMHSFMNNVSLQVGCGGLRE